MQSSGAIPGLCFGYIDYCVEPSNARLRELIEGPIQTMLDNFSFTRVRSYRVASAQNNLEFALRLPMVPKRWCRRAFTNGRCEPPCRETVPLSPNSKNAR
jgi:hypothetical protein